MMRLSVVSLFLFPVIAAAQPNERILQRLGTNQLRHGSRILCLAYSPNGQLLAAGGGSDPIRMWDTATGLQKYSCPETWINAIVFSGRGSLFITGGMFKTVRVWDTETGKPGPQLVGHAAPVKALAMSPENTILASGGQDGTVIFWEIGAWKKITEVKHHTDEVTAIAFSGDPDALTMVTGSNDRTICIYNAATQQLKHRIDAGCGVLAVAVSHDGRFAFSAGDDNLIRVWQTKDGKLVQTLKGHQDMVVSLVLGNTLKVVDGEERLDRGKLLVSAGRDKTIRIWRTDNPAAGPRVIQRHLGDSDALTITRDGTRIATAGLNNTIRIFETASGKELFASGAPQAALVGLTLSRDGQRIAAVTATGTAYLWGWELGTGKFQRTWATGHSGDVVLTFRADGQHLITASDSVRVWDPHTGQLVQTLPIPIKPGVPVIGLAAALDGKTLAVGTCDGTVHVYDFDQKRVIDTFAYPGQPAALAFSLDSGLLAVSGSSKIILRDFLLGQREVGRFECKDAPPKTILPDVAALAFSPDRRSLAAACFDGVIRLIDFNTGKEISVCEGHQSVPYAIAFAPDGRTLLSGSFDSTVRLWEPFSGAQIADFKGHSGAVYGAALSPDARIAYSAGADTSVIVWDTTGFGKAGPPKGPVNGGEYEQLWRGLAGDNAAAARQTIWRLIANPPGVTTELKKRVYLMDVARIDKLIGALDSEDYDTREAADRELSKDLLQQGGRWLEAPLRAALVKPPSLEFKRRVELLLDKLDKSGALSLRSEQIRLRRAMMVLEYIADPGAADLLGKLTKQGPEPAFRQEAQMTLTRMRRP